MKQLKNGSFRYKNVTLEPTPTEKFPEMVTIVKTQAKLKELFGKKFISLEKAQIAIETVIVENLINQGNQSIETQFETFKIK